MSGKNIKDTELFQRLIEQSDRALKGFPTLRELALRLPPPFQDIPQTTELGKKIRAALQPMFVHDEIVYDFSTVDFAELEMRTLALMMDRPIYGKSPVEDIMQHKYRNRDHAHITTPCEGRCKLCGEKIHESHEERIEKLERKLEDMERNLKELAGIKEEA